MHRAALRVAALPLPRLVRPGRAARARVRLKQHGLIVIMTIQHYYVVGIRNKATWVTSALPADEYVGSSLFLLLKKAGYGARSLSVNAPHRDNGVR